MSVIISPLSDLLNAATAPKCCATNLCIISCSTKESVTATSDIANRGSSDATLGAPPKMPPLSTMVNANESTRSATIMSSSSFDRPRPSASA